MYLTRGRLEDSMKKQIYMKRHIDQCNLQSYSINKHMINNLLLQFDSFFFQTFDFFQKNLVFSTELLLSESSLLSKLNDVIQVSGINSKSFSELFVLFYKLQTNHCQFYLTNFPLASSINQSKFLFFYI